MGIDIFPAIAQWDRLADTVNQRGMDGLFDMFWVLVPDDELDDDRLHFTWPSSSQPPWYGECCFRGKAASKSIRMHSSLSYTWDGARGRRETPADLIPLFDRLVGRLLGRWSPTEDDDRMVASNSVV
ncbi:hypothetical protein [Nocardia huaxiensis]|uniref:hypothetical protein n=1 Tax=Nocardia huaxiensis TaxID=2755382 RepID=UPI001E62AC9F|nr:hypothetical protein [Nocardia huaxiensis]UFS98182.1 hypothetical protein LPY97_09950 [Nocardia huaxiensis]